MFKRNNEDNNGKAISNKKKIILVSGTIVTAASIVGTIGIIIWKKQNNKPVNNETEMLRDIVLEAGVFEAAISNIARKLDIKRSKLAKYLAGSNVDENKLQQFKDDIAKLEKMLAYAVNMKQTMIEE